MKDLLKKLPFYKGARAYYSIIWGTFRKKTGFWKKIGLLKKYFTDIAAYRNLKKNPFATFDFDYISPRIYDNTPESQGIDPVYFYQDSWCAKKVFGNKPTHHYDIGSKAEMVGIISQFVPTTLVDIRPIGLSMPGFHFAEGDATALPFKDGSIPSLSSICVLEHIGLGRYGDTLNPLGTENAAQEIVRVLAKEGDLYISVPVDNENRVHFNAHRSFTREYVLEMFSPLVLMEEQYIYGRDLFENYAWEKGFGVGLFYFKKR